MFRIREANGRDLPAILLLINAHASHGKVLKRSRKEIRRALRCFLVADIGDRVVGCAALEVYNKKLAEIRSLVVEPRFQKQGIAAALIDRCLERARKKNIYEVLAITDRDSVFTPHGFTQQLHGQKALFLRP